MKTLLDSSFVDNDSATIDPAGRNTRHCHPHQFRGRESRIHKGGTKFTGANATTTSRATRGFSLTGGLYAPQGGRVILSCLE